ncbi:hypothetical protein [uncultured Paracoccus sp.]|uniref:hypothetical protein n=1 Tax=uncultured Paracoccus sp. TaxID=189685 RepID=UPI0026341FB9|nr:hypothetical protein [uncultured Paracoccus sp.]
MKFLPARLAAPVALSLALAAPATAQITPPRASAFSAEGVIGGITRLIVSYGRMFADLRYGALAVDGPRGTLVMRDLEIAGQGKYQTCRVSLDRLQVSGLSLWAQEEAATRLDLSGVAIATQCFGMNGAMIAAVIDDDMIRLDAVSLDARQSAGSGSLAMDIEAIAPGLARIEGSADFAYVSMFIPEFFERIAGGNSDPADSSDDTAPEMADGPPEMGVRGRLRAAHLSLEDLGGWEKLRPILPPQATSPEGLQALVTAEPGTPQQAFQQALADALKAFVAEPGRLTAEIRPAAPVAFETSDWTGPDEALTVFAPVLTNALPTPPLALVANPDDASDPRALGLALAEGKGLPRNPRRAIELLTPLQKEGEIALALAGLKADSDPRAAYTHAMTAAGQGVAGSMAELDRIEARLKTDQLIAAQPGVSTALPDAAFASVVSLRDAALAQEQGDGTPRSYALALRLAGSAAAAGDGPSEALLARLEGRFAGDPAWEELRAAAADQALADWRGMGLAARFSGE